MNPTISPETRRGPEAPSRGRRLIGAAPACSLAMESVPYFTPGAPQTDELFEHYRQLIADCQTPRQLKEAQDGIATCSFTVDQLGELENLVAMRTDEIAAAVRAAVPLN